MSAARRAYDMLRGYVNREWDRIQGLERSDAMAELEESLDPGSPNYKMTSRTTEVPPADAKAYARQVLGVLPDAGFDEVRKAFERLNKRADPTRFAAGSPEARQASEIQTRVHWAYTVLTEGLDDTERRFRSLEIE